MPPVMARISESEPKSGCSASSTTSTMATPIGLSMAGHVALTSSL